MPKSKRNKQIELAKTKKRGLAWKKGLFEEVRSCVDSYANVFVFSVNDMRNNKMKDIREQWKHSRFFIGKNKIMAMALGTVTEKEYKPNLHKIGQQIRGQRGLLFSNKSVEEVLNWFRSYSAGDFARSGNIATETVNLPAGPLTMFPYSQEPYLRQLGLPTSLVKGVIHLVKDHEVCKEGDVLTPETAKILKLLGYQMAEFHITINCVWSQDGLFQQITENVATEPKKNKKSSFTKSTESLDIEEMDVKSANSDDESSDDEPPELVDGTTATLNESTTATLNESTTATVNESTTATVNESTTATVNESTTATVNESTIATVNESTTATVNESTTATVNESTTTTINGSTTVTLNGSTTNSSLNGSTTSTPKEKTDFMKNKLQMSDEEMSEITDKTSDANENEASSHKRGRPRLSTRTPRGDKAGRKKISIVNTPKTPDANTSQDSPVFRELRNRSVKVNRKRK